MINTKSLVAGLSGLALVASVAASVTLMPTPAQAGRAKAPKTVSEYLGDAWNYHLYFPFMEKLGATRNVQPRSQQEQRSCEDRYARILAKGEMKIAVGLGYYDFSEGETFDFDYRDENGRDQHMDFGMNATMDGAMEHHYRGIITGRCKGEARLCGFKEEGPGRFVKKINGPNRKKIRAVIELKNSSVSTSNATNIGAMAAEQQVKSDQTTRWFFSQFSSADLVVYNGHSRKGGGPDFHPPKLLKNLHANYGWYEKNEPGLNRLLTALNQTSQKPAAFLMMSCNSNKLFADRIVSAAPGMTLVTTNAIPPTGETPTKGALAGMDAFLRFQCAGGLVDEMTADHDMKDFFIFDETN